MLNLETITLLVAGGMLATLLSSRPAAALGLWLGALAFTPVWLAVTTPVVVLTPSTFAAVLVAPAALRVGKQTGWQRGDTLLLLAALCMAWNVFLEGSPQFQLNALILEGVTSYLIARRLVPAVGMQATINLIARGTVILAIWSIIEFTLDWHAFETLTTSSPLTFWSSIQDRGGLSRTEAAWGHPIALGAALSLGIPFIYGSDMRKGRWTWALVLTIVGSIFTISRAPISATIVALLVCIIFLHGHASIAQRVGLAFAGAAATIVGVPLALEFLQTAPDIAGSTQFRAALLDNALLDLHLFGPADNLNIVGGALNYRGEDSVDNNLILVGLVSGVLTSALLHVGVVVALVRAIFSSRATVADVALGCQLIVLATVATITQYHMAVFFVAGVAVTFAALERQGVAEDEDAVEKEGSPAR